MAGARATLFAAFALAMMAGPAFGQSISFQNKNTAARTNCAPVYDNTGNRWVLPCAQSRLRAVQYDQKTEIGPQTRTAGPLATSAMTAPGVFSRDLGPGMVPGSRLSLVGGRDATRSTIADDPLHEQTGQSGAKSFFTGVKLSFPLN